MTTETNYHFDPDETQTFGDLTVNIQDYFPEGLPTFSADLKDTNPKDAVGTRKAPMSTVPGNVLAEMGVAMLEGATKYGRHNYRAAGVRASVYYDAAMRHLIAWWEGEDIDPDSGMSHITKLLACMAVLRDAMHQEMWEDDRPPRSKPFYGHLNLNSGYILDKNKDINPRHYTIKDSK
jgi:hypothetical protein